MAKQKLFIPRKIEGEGSRWGEWNKEQPTKVIDGKEVRINQWDLDGKKQGYWEAFKKEPAAKKIADGKTEFNKTNSDSDNDIVAGIMRLRNNNK